MPKLTLEDIGTFDMPADKRLVLALTDDCKIDQLHACGGNARCTTCRVQFVSGEPAKMIEIVVFTFESRRVGIERWTFLAAQTIPSCSLTSSSLPRRNAARGWARTPCAGFGNRRASCHPAPRNRALTRHCAPPPRPHRARRQPFVPSARTARHQICVYPCSSVVPSSSGTSHQNATYDSHVVPRTPCTPLVNIGRFLGNPHVSAGALRRHHYHQIRRKPSAKSPLSSLVGTIPSASLSAISACSAVKTCSHHRLTSLNPAKSRTFSLVNIVAKFAKD